MLDHTVQAAHERGIANIAATQGDARSLPYEESAFDGAFLVTVLGEIPDQDAALRELHRVIKPGGRLVVGELFGDPHWVRFGPLQTRARRAGFQLERRIGTGLGYFARFRKPPQAETAVDQRPAAIAYPRDAGQAPTPTPRASSSRGVAAPSRRLRGSRARSASSGHQPKAPS
jgi:hypothetical protein